MGKSGINAAGAKTLSADANKISKRRVKLLAAIFALLSVLLAVRLWYIQVSCHDEFAAAALSQQEIVIEGLDSRGAILDRNLQPLTGGVKQYYYIVSKKRKDARLSELTAKLEARQIAKASSAYLVYRTECLDEEINEELKENYGAYAFSSSSRYADEQTACHFVGYVNQNEKRGVAGLELMCEDVLADDGSRLVIMADAAGNILKGAAPAVLAADGSVARRAAVTTIDRRIQYVCETALQEAGSGGAMVVDADTGEILAWASSPAFNPNRLESYLQDESDCLVDKVCQGSYAPGSVFKIVTAAAALESGVCDRNKTFECSGKATVGGVEITCAAAPDGGHGLLNMEEAMAVSCNCYFAQLGELVGCGRILDTAEELGFGRKLLGGFPQETAGLLPGAEETGPWDVSNLSIGQGRLLVTVAQVAKMTAIVAEGGIDVELTFLRGEAAQESKQHIAQRRLPAAVAADLESMLSAVMATGTGRGRWAVPVFGKTGTAEAAWRDEKVKNCWFTGYAKIGGHTYVITVLVERGSSGAYDAMPVFKAVVDFLAGSA